MPPDPLAGQREKINTGERTQLTWPDDGQGWPVEEGQTFDLRDCSIEITSRRRSKGQLGTWWFIAEFIRYPKRVDRVHLLGRSGGYTEDEAQAMRAQDGEEPGTLYGPGPEENPLNLVQPPEPEAVPPAEIPGYTGSQQARARFESDVQEDRSRFAMQTAGTQLDQLRQLADAANVDVSSDVRVIEQRLARMRGKVLKASKEMEAA